MSLLGFALRAIPANRMGSDYSSAALGRAVAYRYDAVGRLSTVTDPTGRVTTYTYDVGHRLLTITDPRGTVTRFAYDPLNRLTVLTNPRWGMTAFIYGSNGTSCSRSRC